MYVQCTFGFENSERQNVKQFNVGIIFDFLVVHCDPCVHSAHCVYWVHYVDWAQ